MVVQLPPSSARRSVVFFSSNRRHGGFVEHNSGERVAKLKQDWLMGTYLNNSSQDVFYFFSQSCMTNFPLCFLVSSLRSSLALTRMRMSEMQERGMPDSIKISVVLQV